MNIPIVPIAHFPNYLLYDGRRPDCFKISIFDALLHVFRSAVHNRPWAFVAPQALCSIPCSLQIFSDVAS